LGRRRKQSEGKNCVVLRPKGPDGMKIEVVDPKNANWLAMAEKIHPAYQPPPALA